MDFPFKDRKPLASAVRRPMKASELLKPVRLLPLAEKFVREGEWYLPLATLRHV